MNPPAVSLLSSTYFNLLQTPNGGRSLFATKPIPADTLIHISHSPCASVVYREFRKVVCAWCFGDKNQEESGWCITKGQGNGRERFCGEVCRDLWMADGARCGGLRERVDKAIDAAVRRMNKSKAESGPDHSADDRLEITQTTLDAAWIAAESETAKISQLDEMELEIARFVSSALVQLHAASVLQNAISGTSHEILALQQNELPHTLQRPYILKTHIRISQFLRAALSYIPEMRTYVSMNRDGNGWVRNILGRDAGNSFGIWEQASESYERNQRDEEREMFGWGIWADASFFNHNCTPNVIKTRSGRTLHFTTSKAIMAGEELCISYVHAGADLSEDFSSGIDVADDTEDRSGRERRKKLREHWFFACTCERCLREERRLMDML